jgi:cytochrome P450
MSPPPPQAAWFDESRGAWVLSRYRDVVAALRDPQLWPVAARGEDQDVTRDEAGRLRLRGPSQDALSAARVADWQAHVEPLAKKLLDGLAKHQPVDLLADFALPWCFEFALRVLDADPAKRDLLSALGADVFAATGAPDDSPLRPRAADATAELVRLFENGPMPMGEPTFVAISQTTPRLLANIWLSLFAQPTEIARLRASPALWSSAVDELLRFGGIVRRIWRQAKGKVDIGGVTIQDSQRVMLMLASANRDPEQFAEPDRLDVTRHVTAQLALGAGRNSCVGATVIRMGVAAGTRVLVEKFPEARLCGTPEWCIGSGYCFPTSVPILLCGEAQASVFT